MVCRDEERGRQARDALRREAPEARVVLELADLSDLASARALGDRLHALGGVDVLVNNAGVARMELELTADGLERTMATNHLGHFVITLGLLDRLRAAGGRVINVSSEGHRRGDLRRAPLRDVFRGRIAYNGFQAYCDSKLANVLFTMELDRRYAEDGLSAVALHPGVLSTRIWNKDRNWQLWLARLFKPLMGSPEIGGDAVFRLVADPEAGRASGVYFKVREQVRAAEQAYDERLAGELWEASEALAAG
jgi:NAD(P)-dependent dehydrogenase (short-subunit alcohol dehydrogenase family)